MTILINMPGWWFSVCCELSGSIAIPQNEEQGQGEDNSYDARVAPSLSPDGQKHDIFSSAQMQSRKSTGAADAIEAALSSGTLACCAET